MLSLAVHRSGSHSRSSGSHVALLQTLRPTRALHLAVELLSFVAACLLASPEGLLGAAVGVAISALIVKPASVLLVIGRFELVSLSTCHRRQKSSLQIGPLLAILKVSSELFSSPS
ncbi:hypothetical protein Ahy_B07g087368 [Arachis hypogaea]|uniref:Uncharacterized protein n=1 Tax=Arachis hypogaea TaxID=3818 RepID=A0A444YBZ8_ARAHY|nr:hypothetical protein Ahy_B07g087368 [Arachis hypogaea]